MTLNLYSVFTVINLFMVLVLIFYFAFSRRGNGAANKILSFLLLLFLLQIIKSFTTSNYAFHLFMDYHRFIYPLQQSALLIGPVLLLYIQLSVTPGKKFRFVHLLHTLPFIAFVIYGLFLMSNYEPFIIWGPHALHKKTVFIVLCHNLVYIFFMVGYTIREKVRWPSILNEIRASTVYGWLQFFIFSFILLWVVNLYIFASLRVTNKTSWCAFTNSIYALALFLFMVSILLIILFKPDIYFRREKYAANGMSDTEKELGNRLLRKYMLQKKPYLDPDISLEKMAYELNMSCRHLSQLINESYHSNFRTFINAYRIRESKNRLVDPEHAEKTVLEILYETGFNSKSVFNEVFKKQTGLSPVAYRKKFLPEDTYQKAWS